LGVVAGVLVYGVCWAATAQFGASAVAASVSAEQAHGRVSARSPFPFVVSVHCTRRNGAGFSAKYVWLGGITHEVSREPDSPLSPFIYTLF
jgi:hypothetical protein